MRNLRPSVRASDTKPSSSVGSGRQAAPFWLSRAQSTFPATSAAYLQLLFTVDTPYLLVVHLEALSRNHHVYAATTKPTPFSGHPLDRIA